MSKRILITGASGQIGTNLCFRLRDMGYELFGVDKRPNAWTQEFPLLMQDLSSTYRNHLGGIGNCDYGKIDLVVHLAANAKVHELVEHPERALDNFLMTFNVIEYCRQNKVPLVFSSTREVYGDVKRYVTTEKDACFSTTESPYSASKISSEAYIYAYAKCYAMKYLVFRFSNVYGRYDDDIERMERVIPLFWRKLSRGEPITLFGKDKVLDFTYVDDCVDGIARGVDALLKGEVCNQTFNLAYGVGNPLTTVPEVFSEILGITPNITFLPSRLGEVTTYTADISNARKLLGYNPQTPLREGLRKAAAWYDRKPS